jgi:hypothetical protein
VSSPTPPPALVEDQWLPEKLARVGVFLEIEKGLYSAYRTMIRDWLDAMTSAVLTSTGIDPLGVYAAATQWADLLDTFTGRAVVAALGKAYEYTVGESYEFSNRPFVQRYIQDARNRLVHTPDEVYAKVKDAVSEGTQNGRGIPEIAAHIKRELLDAGAPYWKNRAVTVARTETIGAYNGGANDAFAAIVGEFPEDTFEKIWLATDDNRTRHTHNVADGQRVPYNATFDVGGFSMAYPGDPTGPAEEVINCRCTMLLVEKGEEVDYSNKGFKGLTASTQTRPRALGLTASALIASVLPGVTEDFASLLASAWITGDWKLHATCATTFCRNPLHPGPCKGWKHTLKKVAPGAYDALEKARIEKLNQKRTAKIKQLQDAGKKIPKALLKPIKSIEPKPGPVDVTPDQPPLSADTEKKLADVTAKTKKAFDQTLVQKLLKKDKPTHEEGVAAVEAMDKDDWDKLTPSQRTMLTDFVSDAKKADTPGADKASEKLSNFWSASKPEEPKKTGPIDGDGDGKLNEQYVPKGLSPKQAELYKDLASGDKRLIKTKLGKGGSSTNAWWVATKQPNGGYADIKSAGPTANALDKKGHLELKEDKGNSEHWGLKAPGSESSPATTLGEKPQYTTISQAGLKAGDKVMVHVPETFTKKNSKGLTVSTEGPVPAKGTLATVEQNDKNGVTGWKLVGEDGKTIYNGGGATKYHLSKAPEKSDSTSDGNAPTPAAKATPAKKALPKKPEPEEEPNYITDLKKALEDPNADADDIADAAYFVPQEDIDKYLSASQKAALDEHLKKADPTADEMLANLKKNYDKGLMTKAEYEFEKSNIEGGAPTPAGAPIIPPDGPTEKANEAGFIAFSGNAYTKAQHIEAYDDLEQEDIDSLDDNGIAVIVHDLAKLKKEGLSPGEAGVVAKVESFINKKGGDSTKDVKPDFKQMFGDDGDPDHKQAVDAVEAMDQDDWDSLTPGEKSNAIAHIGDAEGAEYPGATQALMKIGDMNAPTQGSDVHAKPPSSVNPDAIGDVSTGSEKANVDQALDVSTNSHKYAKSQIIGAYESLSKADWDSLSSDDKAKIADHIKQMANDKSLWPEQHDAVLGLAGKFGNTHPIGTPEQQELSTALKVGSSSAPELAINLPKDQVQGLSKADLKYAKALTKKLQESPNPEDRYTGEAMAEKFGFPKIADMEPKAYLPSKPKATPAPPPPSVPAVDPGMPKTVNVPKAAGTPATNDAGINPAAGIAPGSPKTAADTFKDWQDAKAKVSIDGLNKATNAYKVGLEIKTGSPAERVAKYADLDAKKFANLPEDTQAAIVADLDNIVTGAPEGHFPTGLGNSAAIYRELLTGKPPLSPFTPTAPKPKSAGAAKKVANLPQASQDAAAAVKNVGDGKPLDRLKAYQGLTADDLGELPALTQKEIVKDLGNMAYAYSYGSEFSPDFGKGYNNPNKQQAKDLLKSLIGTETAKGFKPKTKAQKEYEKVGDAMFAPGDGSGFTSNDPAVYKKKVAVAKKGPAALDSVPLDLVKSSTFFNLALHNNDVPTATMKGNEWRTAADEYKGAGYHPINDSLRQLRGKFDEFDEWDGVSKYGSTYSDDHKARIKKYIGSLDEAMKASKIDAPIITMRGFGTPEQVFGHEIWGDGTNDLTGMEWTEHGFSSTTTSLAIAKGFAGAGPSTKGKPTKPGDANWSHDSSRVMMRIFTPKGVGGIQLSGKEYESEMLLDRGVKFRVVKDNGVVNGARQLDVEVIEAGVNG